MSNEEIKQIKETLKYYETTKTEPTYCEELITTGELKRIVEEVERLNNIINELEKWLECESNFWKEQQEKAIKNGWLEFGGKYNTTIIYENALDKLQELKGSE